MKGLKKSGMLLVAMVSLMSGMLFTSCDGDDGPW